MGYLAALSTELLKLRRTRIPWVLGVVYGIGPLMLGLMMLVLKEPELGRRMGLMTAKAEMTIGTPDWPTYLAIVGFLFVGGIIVLGVAQAFVFGREFVEGTAKNMLTLPVGRGAFVTAKLTLTAAWFLAMISCVYAEAIGVGMLIGLPGLTRELLAANLALGARLAVQVLLLSSIPAWIAVATRGYLAPLGLSILLLLVGDLFAHTGWGPWVPWSIPLLSAGVAGSGGPVPGVGSAVVLVLTFVAGALATWATLDRVDNTQ
jgi:ABC-2 type transport system permease protein